ncbi:MAG: phosphatidyl-myo-inositol alpha-mannosyltransferase [Solirubrobacteraceae bacterium]|nr:phosphatidyl-myo-inositol alpha-mannosyltransferase [Solirubrobacteraceae bacterium]
MRVALVSPYSWTVPGGVNQHVEALAEALRDVGHEAHIFAPADTGVVPRSDFTSVGTTVGLPFNGARSNVAMSPRAALTVRRVIGSGGFDVVHVHEPVAAMVGRQAVAAARGAVVGTFHAYSEARLPHALATVVGTRALLNRLHARIAVSEAAAWTGRRFYGGRYRIVPNGVRLEPDPAATGRPGGAELHVVFVGQAVERKGLPVLLRAVAELRGERPIRLTVVGANPGTVGALLPLGPDVVALGNVGETEKTAALRSADILCAPSLHGESFGLVLAEAFAVGTPVVASDIPGYRDVVDGASGVLFTPGDPAALVRALRALDEDRAWLAQLAEGAARAAQRYAWPRVVEQVVDVYEAAMSIPAPASLARRAGVRTGIAPADGQPEVWAKRLPSLVPSTRHPARTVVRVMALVVSAVLVWAAVTQVAWDRVTHAVLVASPLWTLLAVALMSASLMLRAGAWQAILTVAGARAPMPAVVRATAIGVLMSATAPARIGEAARVLILSRRTGEPSTAPLIAGTILAQTVVNTAVLCLLGAIVVDAIGLPGGRVATLAAYAAAPLAICAIVIMGVSLGASRQHSRGPWAQGLSRAFGVLSEARRGLAVFRRPRRCAAATGLQLAAWALQWIACIAVLHALHVTTGGRESVAAAAILLAVNVSAILPVTPANVGIFQAACVTVLAGSFHVGTAEAVGYGIVLQAVEVATAVACGVPALVGEGLTWHQARQRALAVGPAGALTRASTPAPA